MEISRRGRIDPFMVMKVMDDARQLSEAGRDIVSMEAGQPGTGAPAGAVEALSAALRAGPLGYTVSLGLPALRERIARRYADRHGIDVSPDRIAITTGASGGFLLAFLALFDAGDRVGLAAPGYPAYRHILSALDLRPVTIPTGPETRFQPTPALIANAGRLGPLKGLIVGHPANPTGTALSRDELVDLIEECQRIDAAFICDEIYHGIDYGSQPVSALELSQDVIVLNSFSKYFSMTGWRVGWMVAPEPVIAAIERLAQNFTVCPPHASQIVALAAMDCEAELDANVAVYAANRDLLMEELPKAGFGPIVPCDGAFYLYADVSALTDDSLAFCERMLQEAGVAATPGVDFDAGRGKHFVRFSFAGPTERMAEGARRLQAWLKG
jgi:aspartate/methionine/tyrosine aminotransferase